MWESSIRYLRLAWASLRLADALDAAVVAVFIYVALVALKGARSRRVILGLGLLGAIYLTAELLDMELTRELFKVAVRVGAVALVVIFQEDLRRGFERLARLGRGAAWSRSSVHPIQDANLDVLVAVATQLAQARTGALIVLQGREALERHLMGGVELNGQLSEPLLLSIFDTSSPGHDGAVIVESGVTKRFAVHLPLSVDERAGAPLGTRHRAAIGLSERCDALVIVVSEERGVMSLARAGRLSHVSSVELRERIQAFVAQVTPRERSRWAGARTFEMKLLSVVLAAGGWLVAFGYRSETAVRTLAVPVVIENVPEGWIMGSLEPPTVLVGLSGPRLEIEQLNPSDVTVSLDVSHPGDGPQQLAVSSADVDAPKDVVVQSVEPGLVRFDAERSVNAAVRVEATTGGALPNGYALESLSVEPELVRLIVPQRLVGSVRRVPTHPVVLDSITQSTSLSRTLILPDGVELAPGEPHSVRVRIQVAKKTGAS